LWELGTVRVRPNDLKTFIKEALSAADVDDDEESSMKV
jgi:hypothetical protein